MKNPKVGERCRRYSYSFPGEFFDGVITRVINGDVVEVKPDKGSSEDFHHRTHLVRLKPKKRPREIWVYEDIVVKPGCGFIGASVHERKPPPPDGNGYRRVKFREVLE